MYGRTRKKRYYRRSIRGYRKRSYPRRIYRRRRPIHKVRTFRKRWSQGTTISRFKKFIYNDEDFVLSVAALTPTPAHVWRGNSIYDPDFTGVGIQPFGHDQVMGVFYNNYCVKASKIAVYPSVRITQTGESGQPLVKILVVPFHLDALTTTDFPTLIRMPGARYMIFNAALADSPGGNKLVAYTTTRKVMGQHDALDHSASAAAGSNPGLEWYWHVMAFRGPWQEDFTVNLDVKITYYTELNEKLEINPS